MSKKRCGSCRFYQEAGLASSGWCHHPQRRTTSDLMIMVRHNELACRDAWARDLWESASSAGAKAPANGPPTKHPAQPLRPASEDEIAAVVQASASAESVETPTASLGEDVVISESGVPLASSPEAATAWTWTDAPLPPSRESDAKTAIRKARDAYRERLRRAVPRDGVEAPLPANHRAEAPSADVDEPIKSGDQRPAVDQEPALVVGERDPAASGAREPDPATEAGVTTEPPGVDPLVVEESGAAPSESDQQQWSPSAPLAEPTLLPRLELRQRRMKPFGSPPAASFVPFNRDQDAGAAVPASTIPPRHPVAASDWHARSSQADVFEADAAIGPESASLGADQPETDSPTASVANDRALAEVGVGPDEPADEPWAEAYGAATAVAGAERARADLGASGGDLAPAAANDGPFAPSGDDRGDPLDAGDRGVLAPELRRICRTCRDFRPAEGGDRGWCANEWAFSHRRVVGAADEVPCESTLGHWWLPVDEIWLNLIDVSDHGQATPLLDAWLPHHREEPIRERRRS